MKQIKNHRVNPHTLWNYERINNPKEYLTAIHLQYNMIEVEPKSNQLVILGIATDVFLC